MTDPDSFLPFKHEEILSSFDPDNRLTRYFDLLTEENRYINLVSRETSLHDLAVLAAESLLPLSRLHLPYQSRYLDIGTGGGFPAIPILLAAAIREGILVERRSKKARAILRMLRPLGLAGKVQVAEGSFESMDFTGPFDLITIRLVTLTAPILEKALSLLGPDGTLVYYSNPETPVDPYGARSIAHWYETNPANPAKCFSIIQRI